MAFRWIVSLLFVGVVASTSEDFAKLAKDVELIGDSLPKIIQKQWASKLAQQKQNISSAGTALSKSVPSLVKSEVADAISQLNKVEEKVEAELGTFVKLQLKQVSEISKKYKSFITQRLSAKGAAATDESSIHKIRQESQQTVNSWVPALSKIHEAAHKEFEGSVRTIAEKISKTKTPQIGDQVRVAITNLGVQLLNVLIEEQNGDTSLLTGVQFNLYNNFFQKAETLLIKLLVSAKSATSSSGSSVSSSQSPSPSGSKSPSPTNSGTKPTMQPTEPQPSPASKTSSPKATKTQQSSASETSSNSAKAQSETKSTAQTSDSQKASSSSKDDEFDYDEYQN